MTFRKSTASILLALGVAALATSAVAADRITIKVGFAPGAAFDIIARTVASHLGSHLPGNPDIIVENVDGAGSRRLLNLYLATGATDGTEIAMVSAGFALEPILNPDNADFDPSTFNYLVSFSNFPTYCLTTAASGITTMDQLLSQPVNVGGVGRDASYLAAAAINRALGGQFNIVSGFAGMAEVNLALARGELQAICGRSYSSMAATRQIFDFNVVGELSPVSFGLVPGAEFVIDRAADPTTRAALALVFSASLVWFPMMVHPDTPPETVAILRDAFAALATDEAFVQELLARGVEISLTDGAAVQALVEGFLSQDEAVKELARQLVQ